ncbi:hypothetical protein LINPERHAP1_LOCUS43862 [Linum perenne]
MKKQPVETDQGEATPRSRQSLGVSFLRRRLRRQ